MPRPKGLPKTGGRQPGSLNKACRGVSTARLHELCDELKVDPFKWLLEIAIDLSKPDELRLSALKEACQYLYPKLKAVEHSGEISNPYMEMSIRQLEELLGVPSKNDTSKG